MKWVSAAALSTVLGVILGMIAVQPIAYGGFEYIIAAVIGAVTGLVFHPAMFLASTERSILAVALVVASMTIPAALITANSDRLDLTFLVVAGAYVIGCVVAWACVPVLFPQGNCQVCGYAVEGLGERCPECGTVQRPENRAARYERRFIVTAAIVVGANIILFLVWRWLGP
ncbi:MAG: hypothetical protein ACNA8P_05770 [Phycisphaerales bacterium]